MRAPEAVRSRSARDAVAGLGPLTRFMARRNRVTVAIWTAISAALLTVQSLQSQSLYGTAAKLAGLRAQTEGNSALVAMAGPSELLATIGGEITFELFTYLALLVALLNMFLVGRGTRGDEESAAAELLRSTPVGRQSLLLATLAFVAGVDLLIAAVTALTGVATGLPVAGSVLLGLSVGGVGLVFAALTALAAQLFELTSGAYGAVAVALGAAHALRALGDARGSWLSWLSPVGWGQQTLPYVQDRWWVLLLPLGCAALLTVAATWLCAHRDTGSGLVRPRPGRADARPWFASPLGLVWRLDRGLLLAWSAGALALGALYGSLTDMIEQYVAENPDLAAYFPGGTDSIVDAYLYVCLAVGLLVAAGFGIAAVLRVRGEEATGRADLLLADAVARHRWLGAHLVMALVGALVVNLASAFGIGAAYGLAVSEPGQVTRLLGLGLAFTPVLWVVVGLVAALVGLLPHAAAATGWAYLGYLVVVSFLGDAFDLPGWLRGASPVYHAPRLPLDAVAVGPLAVQFALALALVGAALVGFRRRDIAAA